MVRPMGGTFFLCDYYNTPACALPLVKIPKKNRGILTKAKSDLSNLTMIVCFRLCRMYNFPDFYPFDLLYAILFSILYKY